MNAPTTAAPEPVDYSTWSQKDKLAQITTLIQERNRLRRQLDVLDASVIASLKNATNNASRVDAQQKQLARLECEYRGLDGRINALRECL